MVTLSMRMVGFLKSGVYLLLAPVAVSALTILLGIGGPFVFLMFFGIYFVLGPLLQILVRLAPQDHPANQPTPWGQYFGIAFTMVLRTGAVIALFRLLLAVCGLRMVEPDNPLFDPGFDLFFGSCGLLYAFTVFAREGLWRLQQVFAVRDLPRSTVAAVSLGLAELGGVVRHVENRDGALDPNRTVMTFFWQLLGTEPGPRGVTWLGSYRKDLHPFYLDDGTGRILVDPAHHGVELRRPFISVLTTFFGRRSFEVLLTRHTGKPTWNERTYALREGDTVYVIGNVEQKEQIAPDATDAERLVVRPREQARSGLESLLQFLVPFGRKMSRTPHDVFVIADTGERLARRLLTENFLFSAGLSLTAAALSVLLMVLTGGAR